MTFHQRGVTRRQFGAGLVSLVPALAVAGKAMSETSLKTIDTHAHVFHRGLKLAPGRRYAPDYDAPLSLYLEQLDHNGMSNGVLVQPSFLGTDNSYLVECLKQTSGRLRGIAVVDPAVSADELHALDRAGVVGIRLNLVGQPLPDLTAAEWKTLLAEVCAEASRSRCHRCIRSLRAARSKARRRRSRLSIGVEARRDEKRLGEDFRAVSQRRGRREFCERGLSAAA